jgi:excisionase family DNA binding protein
MGVNMDKARLMTIDEVAGALGVPHLTVYRLIKQGRLRALRVGKYFRLRSTDVEHYMDARMVGGG